MVKFEYAITSYAPGIFIKEEYFCSPDGECIKEIKPDKEHGVLLEILNKRGKQGWELACISTSEKDIVAFWKRSL